MERKRLDERRDELIKAAIRVMTKEGVRKATTRAIVAEAGVSLSVFHYCFRDKQELLEAVVEEITSHSVPRSITRVEPQSTLTETIRSAFQQYWDHVVANPEEHLLSYELAHFMLREPGFEGGAHRQYERYMQANMDFIDQLSLLGFESSTPSPVLARYVAAITDGLTLSWLAMGNGDTAAAALDVAAEHVTSLLQPSSH